MCTSNGHSFNYGSGTAYVPGPATTFTTSEVSTLMDCIDEEPADFNYEIQDTKEEKIQWKTAAENKHFKLKILKVRRPAPQQTSRILPN
ncbi:hypothetical protein JTE90_000993 [Oedothorax gibbosus]|uniref:Uncharacterized protein n=1 Tax=Oedothorax gibbosus TaxID=931172 RepID=A0AAV6VBW0_9ARAC|nr:hypothetical protein JTE90_000993 [Oedothorax gibbosus]